jgi:hypothetical protein
MLILGWLLCGLIAGAIGKRKGEGFLSFIIGIIFGPFGILFALISKGNRINCPYCKELVHKDAVRCSHCQKDLPEKINNSASSSNYLSTNSVLAIIIIGITILIVIFLII